MSKKAEKQEVVKEAAPKAASEHIFTYVGGGEDSPQVIDFMGKQKFVRGKAVEVTDASVLAKIDGHHCFVRGEVDPETLYENDLEAKEAADAQRNRDARMQATIVKRNKKWAMGKDDE